MNDLTSILSSVWAIEPTALKALVAALGNIDPAALAKLKAEHGIQAADHPHKKRKAKMAGDVAHIKIAGPMMREVPWIFELFGIEATSTTGLVAYENLGCTVDLRDLDSLELWIKYTNTTEAGELEIVLDDTA